MRTGWSAVALERKHTPNLTFPEDYQKEDLAGAAVEFKVQISEVQELELALVDGALFTQYGLEEGTEEDFRAEVKQNMERELKTRSKRL